MDIKDFIPSVNELTERGYFAFRMGKKVQEKLKIDNVKFVDYANKFRTDFHDQFVPPDPSVRHEQRKKWLRAQEKSRRS